ncbi:MAG: DUF4129 domain-containing protein [Actinomycetota bacterium]|nr:DUF4129 domain-containing protein [Actinomycetota bacterium]
MDQSVSPLPRPVRMRPLTFGQIVDGGYAALTARPKVMLGGAAVPALPLVALTIVLLNRSGSEGGLANPVVAAAVVPRSVVGMVLLAAAGTLTTALVGVPAAAAVWAWCTGADPSPLDALRQPVRVWLVVLTSWVLVGVVKLVGFVLLVVPGLVAVAFFAVLTPVAVVERCNPLRAIARAFTLSRQRPMRVVGASVLIALSSTAVTYAIGLAGWAAEAWAPDEYTWFVRSVVDLAVAVVVTPAVAASAALLYVDLRCRIEGLDLAWDATRRFGAGGPVSPASATSVAVVGAPIGPAGRGRLPEPVVDPGEVERTADDIVSRPEFEELEPNLVERAFSRALEWLADAIDWLWPDFVPAPGAGGSAALTWLIGIVAAVAIGYLAHRLWRDRGPRRVRRRSGDGITIDIDPDDDADHEREAADLEARGAWREAMLSRYRALAVRLARAGAIDAGRATTTGEHRRAVAERVADAGAAMAEVTGALEAVHYGGEPADRAAAEAFRDRVDAVARRIPDGDRQPDGRRVPETRT